MHHSDRHRGRVVAVCLTLAWASAVHTQSDKPEFLSQGWSNADRAQFYSTSQGSQLMPYDWFLALEQPGSVTLFNADHLERYGYLRNPDAAADRDGLPVGFVKDSDQDGDWVGLNCSACHTNQFRFGAKTLQIDGGPTDADIWALLSDLDTAMAQTSASQTGEKFQRFAMRVASMNEPPRNDAKLFADLKAFSDSFTRFARSSRTDVAWGRARLDAFGMIFNRATGIDLDEWNNTHPPNAPVSYPFLWDTHWYDKVQWNGSAPNKLVIERLGRNVGEVLGVFARTDIKRTVLPPLFFKTTAKRVNLLRLEQALAKLRSPAWPEALAPIDRAKAAKGAELYQTYCVSCHAITPRAKPLGRMTVTMTPLATVGTDPVMATNARDLKSKSGILEGIRMPRLLSVDPIPSELSSLELTSKIVLGAILAPPDWRAIPGEADAATKQLMAAIEAEDGGTSSGTSSVRARMERGSKSKLWADASAMARQQKANTDELRYKARPLDGIWATAPYLHNGSVPNLYQLLLKADKRAPTFFVGTREFDPVNVGFTAGKAAGAFEFDTSKRGNSNAGHDMYGDTMSDDQRRQLVEYLKTL